jgi:outer membrane receptor protein involved in Fe transport
MSSETVRLNSFLILSFILIAGAVFPQSDDGSIEGTISDAAGAVIRGAAIEASGTKTGLIRRTTSSETGEYTLTQMPPDEYKLTVKAPGFRPFIRTDVIVDSGGRALRLNVQLAIDSISQTITVSADAPLQLLDRPEMSSEALKTSTSTVDRIQMEKQGAKTIIDALYYVPGAWIEERGRKVKQFLSIRGQKYPYPEYSLDGAVFREFHEVPYFFSTGDVERVEVLRSSASLLKGINGLAGVIDIVPREYEKRETSWLAEYGSMNSYRMHVSHGQKIGELTYGLGFDGSHTDGPEGRQGAESMVNLFGSLNWKPHPSFSIRTSVFHLQGKRELVQAEPPASSRLQNARERFDPIQTTVATVKTLYQPRDWASTQFTLGYSNRHNTFVAETGSASQTTPDYDSEWNLNLIQSMALSDRNVFRVGANYNHWVAPYGKRFYVGRRSDLETVSVTAADEHSFGRLLLDGAFRYQQTYINEYGAFNINGSSGGFGNVEPIVDVWEPPQLSGSFGATYYLTNRISVRGNFLAGIIEPRRGSLTVDFEEPLNEHRNMLDAGFGLLQDGLGEFSLTGFYIRQKDAIVLTGETEDVNGRITELYDNRDQDSLGLEFEFKSRPIFEGTNFFFNITAMSSRAELEGSMQRDPEKPRVIIGGGILGKRSRFDYNLFWKFVSAYKSSRFASPPVLQPLGDYHTLNLTLGYSLGSSERIRVYLEMTNLTDRRYSTVVGYPDYGRRLQVGIRQSF